MSKAVVIGVVSLGGAGAVGLGGYALFGNGFGFGGSSDKPSSSEVGGSDSGVSTPVNTTTQTRSSSTNEALGTITHTSNSGDTQYNAQLESINGIESTLNGTDGSCFKTAFSNLSLSTSASTEGTFDISSITFDTPTENETSGCLWIQKQKVEFGTSNKKYTGVLSGAGALKGKTYGLVAVGVATASKDNSNLSVEGVVYLLKQANSQWTVEKKHSSGKKTITESKTSNCGGKGKKLPAANHSKLSGDIENCYGTWLDEDDLDSKIATSSDATGGTSTTSSHQLTWNYQSSENTKIYECFNDPHLEWFDNLFGTTNSTLKTKLDSFKGKGS